MVPLSSTSAAFAGAAKVVNPAATTAARPARDRLFACVSFMRLLLEDSPLGILGGLTQRGAACGAGTVFRYATMALICAGSNSSLKPGMRGVPLVMVSRIPSSLPPADSLDSVGP